MRNLFALMLLFACFMGCGPDADVVASAKTHLENIKKVHSQLKESPDDEELKKALREHCLFYKAVIESAGNGKNAKSNLEDKVFNGMDDAERKELFDLIYTTN